MSQAIIVDGANFVGSGLGRALRLTSDRTNLVGEFIFGRDNPTSIFNSAYDGAPNAVAIGTLTYSDHFANPAGANYFRTPILGAENMTILAIVAPGTDATSEVYAASNANAANSWYLASGVLTNRPVVSATSSGGSGNNISADNNQSTPYTDFRGIAGRIGGLVNYTLEVDEFKGGQRIQSKASTTAATRAVDTQVFCMGSIGGSATFNTAKSMSAVLYWQRLLTDQELLDAYLECQDTLRRMGITC